MRGETIAAGLSPGPHLSLRLEIEKLPTVILDLLPEGWKPQVQFRLWLVLFGCLVRAGLCAYRRSKMQRFEEIRELFIEAVSAEVSAQYGVDRNTSRGRVHHVLSKGDESPYFDQVSRAVVVVVKPFLAALIPAWQQISRHLKDALVTMANEK